MSTLQPPERVALPGEITAAYSRIKSYILNTPLMYSTYLSGEAKVYLKLESEQLTGSFKVRGAFNKLLSLKEKDPVKLSKGVTTASTGNHGLACIEASRDTGCPLEIFCRNGGSPSKMAALQALGAKVTKFGNDCVEAETKARQTAQERGIIYVSPYNDWDVVAGQGTLGVEICNQLPDVDCVLVAVGGGGLIGGIAAYCKHVNKNIQIIGCQPYNSKIMYDSMEAGHLVHGESQDTLSDGTAGDVEEGSITYNLCRDLVDRWIIVTEEQISQAVYFMVDKHHKLIEGSAGVAIAAYQTNQEMFMDKTVAIVICGANLSLTDLQHIIVKGQ